VFFIVLDLRLTKVGARRCSFFYVLTPQIPIISLPNECNSFHTDGHTFFKERLFFPLINNINPSRNGILN
jgi:hypothetical protein